jgi:hypothetical protein
MTDTNTTMTAQEIEWDHEDALFEDKERRITDLAKANYGAALDQVQEYDNLDHCLNSYEENVMDTAIELGWSYQDASDACQIFVELAAKDRS